MTPYWVNCLVQGQNDKCLLWQLGDSIQQPLHYWPNALTTRLPATPISIVLFNIVIIDDDVEVQPSYSSCIHVY